MRHPSLLTLLLATAFTAACSSKADDPHELGVDDGGVDAPTHEAEVPADVVYEISLFRLGTSTRDGEESADAWKLYGFDLDGLCTTEAQSATSEGTCLRADKSASAVLTDGDACLDNNFGSQLVPLVKALGGDIETNLVDGVKAGGATLAIELFDLSPTGIDDSVPGAVYAAKSASGASLLDGTDVLDVDESSLLEKDLARPIAMLAGRVEVVDGKRIWKGKADTMPLPVVFLAGATGAIPVRHVRLEIDLATGRGTVGGDALVSDLAPVVGTLLAKQKICPDSVVYTSVQATVAQSADMPEALPHDVTKKCAAISLGLGFELVPATLGKVYPTPAPGKDPCIK